MATEYVDVYSPDMSQHEKEMRLLMRGVPLPIVSIEGEPKFAGGISLDMINAELGKMGMAPRNG